MPSNREILVANLDRLSSRDQDFAASLLSARRPSLSQISWIEKLAQRAVAPPPAPAGNVGPVAAGIVSLFARAATKLKFPKVVIRVGETDIRLSIAGPNSRCPGSVNVTDTGSFDSRSWFGRIMADGSWHPSHRHTAPAGLLPALQCLAADPAGVAAAYGRLTGNCCFCSRPLTDARSVTVGYGPVCAENFGLPWGDARKAAA